MSHLPKSSRLIVKNDPRFQRFPVRTVVLENISNNRAWTLTHWGATAWQRWAYLSCRQGVKEASWDVKRNFEEPTRPHLYQKILALTLALPCSFIPRHRTRRRMFWWDAWSPDMEPGFLTRQAIWHICTHPWRDVQSPTNLRNSGHVSCFPGEKPQAPLRL